MPSHSDADFWKKTTIQNSKDPRQIQLQLWRIMFLRVCTEFPGEQEQCEHF